MKYDPIKNLVFGIIKITPAFRRVFFATLDLLLLRQCHVKKKISENFNPKEPLAFYDAGAGFCQYSDFVLRKWKKSQVFALDLKTEYMSNYAASANICFPKRFEWSYGDLVTYKPVQMFNLISAIDILEHIEDDKQVMTNFYDCLKPGGKLIISTPSDLDEAAKFTAEHVRPGYAPAELKSKLVSAGFRIVSFEFSYGKYGKLSWKLAIKYPLMLLAISKLLILVLPIYYVCTYPVIYLLMKKDISRFNKQGNGLIVVAEKPA